MDLLETTVNERPEEITGGAEVIGFEEDGNLVAGEEIPPNPEISNSFPEIPDIQRIEELFAVDIDENDP